MSTITWGALNKALDSNETIEEAIARLIQDHEDDANAHIENGESLYDHKQSEIIDHLALSIVTDKLAAGAVTSPKITTDQLIGKDIRTATDVGSGQDGVKMTPSGIEMWQDADQKVNIPISGNPTFKGNLTVNSLEYLKFTLQGPIHTLDDFDVTGYTELSAGSCAIETTSVLNNVAAIRAYADQYLAYTVIATKNPIIDMIVYISSTTNYLAYIGYGELANSRGIGFKMEDDSLYAIWHENDHTEHTQAIASISPNALHRYRAEVKNGVEIRFYVDGTLKHTADISAITLESSNDPFIIAYIKTKTTSTKELTVYNYLFQQDF